MKTLISILLTVTLAVTARAQISSGPGTTLLITATNATAPIIMNDTNISLQIGGTLPVMNAVNLSNVPGAKVTGVLTNSTTGNAATATVASFVTGSLTNTISANAATATLASFVSGTLTNDTTGNATTATKSTYVADATTNVVLKATFVGNATTNVVLKATYVTDISTNIAGYIGGTITNDTTGNATTATTAGYVAGLTVTNSFTLYTANAAGDGVVTNVITITNGILKSWSQ